MPDKWFNRTNYDFSIETNRLENANELFLEKKIIYQGLRFCRPFAWEFCLSPNIRSKKKKKRKFNKSAAAELFYIFTCYISIRRWLSVRISPFHFWKFISILRNWHHSFRVIQSMNGAANELKITRALWMRKKTKNETNYWNNKKKRSDTLMNTDTKARAMKWTDEKSAQKVIRRTSP